jgi:hypothetical protein
MQKCKCGNDPTYIGHDTGNDGTIAFYHCRKCHSILRLDTRDKSQSTWFVEQNDTHLTVRLTDTLVARAEESPDREYPGIRLVVSNDNYHGEVLNYGEMWLEYTPAGNSIQVNIWKPGSDEPDFTIPMYEQVNPAAGVDV